MFLIVVVLELYKKIGHLLINTFVYGISPKSMRGWKVEEKGRRSLLRCFSKTDAVDEKALQLEGDALQKEKEANGDDDDSKDNDEEVDNSDRRRSLLR